MKKNVNRYSLLIIFSLLILTTFCKADQKNKTDEKGKEVTLLLKPRPGNPKNFSGDFIRLKDGRILYLYAYGIGDVVADDSPSCTVARYSSDDGKTWTSDDVVVHIEGGLSLLRLPDGRIALFYLRPKNMGKELYPFMIISADETKTWSAPVKCANEPGYYTINNDRVIQLKNGRIIIPVAYYGSVGSTDNNGIFAYYSDDSGETWHQSQQIPNPKRIQLQEPGVVELKDGTVMMFIRTLLGVQYFSYSRDNGEHWSAVQPGNIQSPLSPASIKRIPSTGDLLLVWNDNYDPGHKDSGQRSPLSMAISRDEGKTWEKKKTIESDPNGMYCYTAIQFFSDHVLLGHSAGNTKENAGLETTQVTRLSLDWIYQDATPNPFVKTDSAGTVKLACEDKNATIRYTLDGSLPSFSSGLLYQKPVFVSHPTTLLFQAFERGKTYSGIVSANVGSDVYQKACQVSTDLMAGLAYGYSEFDSEVFVSKDIDALPVMGSGILSQFSIKKCKRDLNFTFTFEGYINIPRDGNYTFYLESNDGSVLFMNGYKFIDNDGTHAIYEKSGSTALRKGKHKIMLKYFQKRGGKALKVSWKGPGFAKTEIPASVLFHDEK